LTIRNKVQGVDSPALGEGQVGGCGEFGNVPSGAKNGGGGRNSSLAEKLLDSQGLQLDR